MDTEYADVIERLDGAAAAPGHSEADVEPVVEFNAMIHGAPGPPDQSIGTWARDLLTRPHPTFGDGGSWWCRRRPAGASSPPSTSSPRPGATPACPSGWGGSSWSAPCRSTAGGAWCGARWTRCTAGARPRAPGADHHRDRQLLPPVRLRAGAVHDCTEPATVTASCPWRRGHGALHGTPGDGADAGFLAGLEEQARLARSSASPATRPVALRDRRDHPWPHPWASGAHHRGGTGAPGPRGSGWATWCMTRPGRPRSASWPTSCCRASPGWR